MQPRTSAVLQFALSIVALVFISSCGVLSLVTGVIQQNARIPGLSNDLSMFLWAAGLGLTAVLILPSIRYSWQAIQGITAEPRREIPAAVKIFGPVLLMLTVFPLAIFTGAQVQNTTLAGWLLPGLNLLTAGLPVLWLLHTAIRNLPAGSPKRFWGVFASGMLLGPQLIIITELMFLAAAIVGFVILVVSRPELAAQLESLSQRLPMAIDSPARLGRLLEPYLENPLLIASVIGFIAVIVPVIEEALKPIGVWFLAGKDLSGAEGFAAGAVSGAAYALFETLFLPSTSANWAAVAVGRVGTTAMHILACALTGWGLALAWREGKYLRLGLQYLAAVAVHSAWNGITVLNAAANLMPDSRLAATAAQALPYSLGFLAMMSLLLLFLINRHLARENTGPDSNDLAV